MATKGPMNTKIDKNAVNELIVYANQYKQSVSESVEVIRTYCRQMEEEESLKGGDGESIRASFKTIADACNRLETSISYIVTKLNEKLEYMIKLNKGSAAANASESAQKAQRNMGVFKKE